MRRHRGLYRARRREKRVPVVSLVGYTNAGKSTLLNRLTGADVAVQDQLFSTLDPVTRQIVLPSGRQSLLTDTVGFIHKLPPTVVAAFRATLEEVQEADALVHVVDITHRNAPEQVDAVEEILEELSLASKPRLMVLNKVDRLEATDGISVEQAFEELTADRPRVVFASALTGLGLDRLAAELDRLLSEASSAASALERPA